MMRCTLLRCGAPLYDRRRRSPGPRGQGEWGRPGGILRRRGSTKHPLLPLPCVSVPATPRVFLIKTPSSHPTQCSTPTPIKVRLPRWPSPLPHRRHLRHQYSPGERESVRSSMARSLLLSLLFFAIFFISEAQNEPEASPSPAPHSGADGSPHFFPQVSPPSMSAPASAPSSRSSVNLNSPPAPPPPEDSPSPPSLGPSMNEEQNAVSSGGNVPDPTSSRGGGNAGRVAGTVVGVVIGAAIVTVAFIIYIKRRQNIRRSQYGFAARRDML